MTRALRNEIKPHRSTIGRSAAGIPQTYRYDVIRSSGWARRLATFLRRLKP